MTSLKRSMNASRTDSVAFKSYMPAFDVIFVKWFVFLYVTSCHVMIKRGLDHVVGLGFAVFTCKN